MSQVNHDQDGIEQTLVLFKPDAVERELEWEIRRRLGRDFKEIAFGRRQATEVEVRQHYEESIFSKPEKADIGAGLLEYMMSGDIYALVLEGVDAIARVREIAGSVTDPPLNKQGTIRKDLGDHSLAEAKADGVPLRNLIHSSDSPEAAEAEIAIWFPKLSVYGDISREAGYASSDFVRRLVEGIDQRKLLFYQRPQDQPISEILTTGVMPEDGQGYTRWKTGLDLFLPVEDSPFFNAEVKGGKPNSVNLALVVAFYDLLEAQGIEVPEYVVGGNTMELPGVVPANLFQMPYISQHHSNPENRAYAIEAAQVELLNHIFAGLVLPDPKLEPHDKPVIDVTRQRFPAETAALIYRTTE